jgi:AraC-like DNA-binding protein
MYVFFWSFFFCFSFSVTMLSPEQLSIVEQNCHVKVDACPGSGKSTLIHHVVRKEPEKTAIVLTYNRSLADSTREKLRDTGTLVYTFHGLASSLFQRAITNDFDLVSLFEGKLEIDWEFSHFELLIIDEAQDLRSIYMHLVKFLIQQCDHPEKLRIMVVGDINQLLYDFYGTTSADSRYLLHFDKIHRGKWVSKHLSQSFRLTGPIVRFVNHVKPSRVDCVSHRPFAKDPPVVIVVCDIYRDSADLVLELVLKNGYMSDDIFILCPSLNNRSPAVKIVQTLVEANIGVNIMRGQKAKVGGKVGLMTFCGSKGLEAEFVIVINTRPLQIPVDNTLFVAMTRAKKELVILQHYQQTSVKELDDIRETMVQRDLCILVKKDIDDIRRPYESKKQNTTPLDSIFTFMDVIDIKGLYEHVGSKVICKDEDLEFDHISIRAIVFALEFHSTSQLPYLFRKHIKQLPCFEQYGETYQKLKGLTDKASRIILYPREGLDNIAHTLAKMKGFAMAALVVECLTSYVDKIDQSFEIHKSVYGRCLFFLTFFKTDYIKWDISYVKDYTYRPLAKNITNNYLIHHSTGIKITPSDVLTAVAGVEISDMNDIYIINVTSGEILQVWGEQDLLDSAVACRNKKHPRRDDVDFFQDFV